jgi:hypothetical protein
MLLPAWRLELHFVGPDVPSALHGQRVACQAGAVGGGSLSLAFWQGVYHDACGQPPPGGPEEAAPEQAALPRPGLVYAPNAGGGVLQARGA